MSLLDILLPRLESEEGAGPMRNGRQLVYRDSKGILTLGFGRNVQDRGLSSDESRYLLINDINECVLDLVTVLPFWPTLNEVRQSVLIDIYFNMRLGNPLAFAQEFAPTLSLIAAGHYREAADHMRGWKWYHDVGPRRADPLIAMMETGIIVTNGRTSARQDRRPGRHGQRRVRVGSHAGGGTVLRGTVDRATRENRNHPPTKGRRGR